LQIQGFSIPALTSRKAETTLELNSGQTFAMAGLIRRDVQARTTQVPGLGDVPILGALFRSVRYQKDDTELLVLVTASLVEPLSVATTPPAPGVTHVTPNDWDLYAMGRIEGKTAAKLSPSDAQNLKDAGLDQLRGPGAWADYGSPSRPGQAAPVTDSPFARPVQPAASAAGRAGPG
jgi:pilus assembly protein CpaC